MWTQAIIYLSLGLLFTCLRFLYSNNSNWGHMLHTSGFSVVAYTLNKTSRATHIMLCSSAPSLSYYSFLIIMLTFQDIVVDSNNFIDENDYYHKPTILHSVGRAVVQLWAASLHELRKAHHTTCHTSCRCNHILAVNRWWGPLHGLVWVPQPSGCLHDLSRQGDN